MREVEPREIGLHLGAGRLEAREDPALLDRRRAYRNLGLARAEQEPRHVPELDRELAALLDRSVREAYVLRRGHLEQPVARGIRAVHGDHLARVLPGAEALRHPPAVGREQRRVDDHVAERHLAEELEAGEDHPVLPEADDLARRRVHVSGVEGAQVGRLFGPAERGERPQRRREPRVEHVLVADELVRAALGARLRLRLLDRDVTFRAVPDRKLVPPPELARGVPVGRVLAQGLERGLLELGHRAPPLERDQGLDPRLAALAARDGVPVRLPSHELTALAQPRQDPLFRLLLR